MRGNKNLVEAIYSGVGMTRFFGLLRSSHFQLVGGLPYPPVGKTLIFRPNPIYMNNLYSQGIMLYFKSALIPQLYMPTLLSETEVLYFEK